jgi:hypothetical protein
MDHLLFLALLAVLGSAVTATPSRTSRVEALQSLLEHHMTNLDNIPHQNPHQRLLTQTRRLTPKAAGSAVLKNNSLQVIMMKNDEPFFIEGSSGQAHSGVCFDLLNALKRSVAHPFTYKLLSKDDGSFPSDHIEVRELMAKAPAGTIFCSSVPVTDEALLHVRALHAVSLCNVNPNSSATDGFHCIVVYCRICPGEGKNQSDCVYNS